MFFIFPILNPCLIFTFPNHRRVNSVETIYAAFPAFLYLNASLAGTLLEPLFELQASSSVFNKGYAAPDLGNSTHHRLSPNSST
jgi:hypothetical protein